jgi:hypothetical protein
MVSEQGNGKVNEYPSKKTEGSIWMLISYQLWPGESRLISSRSPAGSGPGPPNSSRRWRPGQDCKEDGLEIKMLGADPSGTRERLKILDSSLRWNDVGVTAGWPPGQPPAGPKVQRQIPKTLDSSGQRGPRALTGKTPRVRVREKEFMFSSVAAPVRQGAKAQEYRDISSFRNATRRDASAPENVKLFFARALRPRCQ